MLLVADLHLTADPKEEYRWQVFADLSRLMANGHELFVLGDLTEKRDRHPSALVNRLVEQLKALPGYKTILKGNHDRRLYAQKPYWSFLSSVPNISFISQPTARGDLLLLPYADDPREEWKDIDLSLYRCAFIHQSERGYPLEWDWPAGLKVYSGDLHEPIDGDIIYVGAPHPTRYGDTHRCRVLVLDQNYNVAEDITLHPARKEIIEITNADQLSTVKLLRGDMARVRLTLPVSNIEQWPAEQARIAAWANERGIHLESIEPIVEVTPQAAGAPTELSDPIEVLCQFADEEGIDQPLLDTGCDLIREFDRSGT